ncbi:chromate efflux transporter [Deinococcus yavapaiensis]|uniref:Chromate transporter n=1 Tax=Deinococcus yavapaiensis KR-236 TaxID=694435 RepID=A0A318SDZ6_9DEIO|nr:chromate efflux transporter [Deinococcus yavapaiensis]PYE55281.1 chromate transporter [Deinococcus yavapaiensis KR-236]
MSALRDVTLLFLRLGFTAFGGPAAHIAMMHDEVVKRRGWFTNEEFLDLLGATNLIPGPNSTEMAIHIGYRRAGAWGLLLAGAAFIVPAVLIVLGLAWAYVRYGATPSAEGLLYGVKPVIVAVVLHALWALSKTALRGRLLLVAGVVTLVGSLLGVNELALLFGVGVLVALVRLRFEPPRLASIAPLGLLSFVGATAKAVNLGTLFWTFLKTGSVLYGSGYVLLAFLQGDFVDRLGWLTRDQLLDAVAVGQFTPGPVFTTATFVGYLVAGVPGALVATLGIFLPSFVLVALSGPLVPKLRSSVFMSAFLDGVNVAALGLMAAVTLQLGRAAVVDVPTGLLALGSAALMLRATVNSAWLVLAGGLIGLLLRSVF